MHILTVPADTEMLRAKSSPIQEITPELISFLKNLGDTLKNQHDPQGVGLSAIQVGRPIRVFATLLPSASKGPTFQGPTLKGRTFSELQTTNGLLFYINPEILDHSPETTLGEDLVESNKKFLSNPRTKNREPRTLKPFLEGCLSIPAIYGPVPRWSWIKARSIVLSENDLASLSMNYELRTMNYTLDGLPSRVFQHELDHLYGILFTDRTLAAGLQLYRQKEKSLVEMEM